ncbi:K(+)/H(+) antiporter [Microbotryomycetes sp. JL221]|nr:K(+)/H(+) antiporter [Microbotryomycetes sp. JL221]
MAASATTSVAMITRTLVAAAGSTLTTTLPPAPTVTQAAAASIFDPRRPNPVDYDPANPVVLFIVQAAIIVGFSRILGFFLKKIRQPQVIAEVIAGILIGPSVFGRIPNFSRRIFPAPSIPLLNLVANIGLILFLFLVGMETDFSVFRRNYKASVSISAIGMIIPFGLGAAVSVGVYNNFVSSDTNFGTFLLFVGVANAITAFPVLARILTELDLLSNHVGVTVLAAGVGNDVVGWVLLALAIALVNASSGLLVLYIILTSIGWIAVLFVIGRPMLSWLGRKTNSYTEKGPSQSMLCATLFLALASAWVTDRIGIHAIFGSFLVGLIVPQSMRAPLTEKIEDLVAALFLPLYFALSGLKTDLGLLANGSIWGWCICVIVVAFFSKFLSCAGVALLNGMTWRESGAVGSFMACKGLVELIVLNIGLNAGILNSEVFAMFVVMALVTTFTTTPLALAFYPKSYRLQRDRERAGLTANSTPGGPSSDGDNDEDYVRSRFAIVLEHFDHLSTVFAFVKLLAQPHSHKVDKSTSGHLDEKQIAGSSPTKKQVTLSTLRVLEVTDRQSALIKASESEQTLLAADALSDVVRSVATGLLGVATDMSLSVVGGHQDKFAAAIVEKTQERSTDVLVLPWSLKDTHAVNQGAINAQTTNVQGSSSDQQPLTPSVMSNYLPNNPFATLFGVNGAKATTLRDGSPQYAALVRKVFAEATCDVALFVDRGDAESKATLSDRAHLFFAFHGGADDRAALAMLCQLVERNAQLTATAVRIERSPEPTEVDREDANASVKQSTRDGSVVADDAPILFSQLTVHGSGAVDTVYPDRQHDLSSETADNLVWTKLTSTASDRISCSSLNTAMPLHLTISRLRAVFATLSSSRAEAVSIARPSVIVLSGRGRRDAPSHSQELAQYLKLNMDKVQSSVCANSDVRRSLGDVGTACFVSGIGDQLLIVQAKVSGQGLNKKDA